MILTLATARNIDAWNIGMRRVNRIIANERRAGFSAYATGIYSNTVDIFVHKNKMLVRVYESTNYCRTSYVAKARAQRYKNNLLSYPDVQKVFVCSYTVNLKLIPGGINYFTQHGIKVQVMGYQD